MASTSGHGHRPGYSPGCELCQRAARMYQRELRARKRGLTPVPALPAADETAQVEATGTVVRAVQAELAGLGEMTGWQGLAAAAVAMARILDSDGNIPTWPSAARQLATLLEVLHRGVAPRRGRLAVVQEMTDGRA